MTSKEKGPPRAAEKSKTNNGKRWILPLVIGITLALSWVNSMLPRDMSKENSDAVKKILELLFGTQSALARFLQEYIRKIAHFLEYGLLGAEATLAIVLYTKTRPQDMLNLLSLGMFAAVADESILQIIIAPANPGLDLRGRVVMKRIIPKV